MRKFKAVKEKYLLLKVRENNIDYAIDAIKYGTNRELIIKDLIASHRAMDMTEATNMLNDLYAAYGGEHKKENRRGYVYAAMFTAVAVVVGVMELNPREEVSPKIAGIGIVCAVLAIFSFIMAISGKFREKKLNRLAGEDK